MYKKVGENNKMNKTIIAAALLILLLTAAASACTMTYASCAQFAASKAGSRPIYNLKFDAIACTCSWSYVPPTTTTKATTTRATTTTTTIPTCAVTREQCTQHAQQTCGSRPITFITYDPITCGCTWGCCGCPPSSICTTTTTKATTTTSRPTTTTKATTTTTHCTTTTRATTTTKAPTTTTTSATTTTTTPTCKGTRTNIGTSRTYYNVVFKPLENTVAGPQNILTLSIENRGSTTKIVKYADYQCRCKEHIGNPYSIGGDGLGYCFYYWSPGDNTTGCIETIKTITLAPWEKKNVSVNVLQYANKICGSFQLDYAVVSINGATIPGTIGQRLVGWSFTDMCIDCTVPTTTTTAPTTTTSRPTTTTTRICTTTTKATTTTTRATTTTTDPTTTTTKATTTTYCTKATTTTTRATTSTSIVKVPEFGSATAALAILLSTTTLAYLMVRKR